MDLERVEKIANAVLYEGYLLYPYRHSAIKNRQRFNFGVIYPHDYAQRSGESSLMQTECLLEGDDRTEIDVRVRFLHLQTREGSRGEGRLQEAVEREVTLANLTLEQLVSEPQVASFSFPSRWQSSAERDAANFIEKLVVRTQEALKGMVEVAAERIVEAASGGSFRLSARIFNQTPLAEEELESRDRALRSSLVSAHTILSVSGGEFHSLLDPPAELAEAAASCRNLGTFPVLAGEEGERDCLLSSPIILYDYPQIAPESAGDLFDATEIDEMLTLRILTLTDEEKQEMREGDERARQILERSETMPDEQMRKLHGALRSLKAGRGQE